MSSGDIQRQFSGDDEVRRMAEGVFDLSLPKAQWTHAAHFAFALWLLRNKPRGYAEAHLPQIIRAYNEATGVANTDSSGYHETITLASLQAARAFLEDQPPDRPLQEMVGVLMQTRLGDSRWMEFFWTRAALFSKQARGVWVDPDIRPLSKDIYLVSECPADSVRGQAGSGENLKLF